MLPDILLRELRGIIEERMAPTPFAKGEILPISNYGMELFTPGYQKYRSTIVSSFRVYNPAPFSGKQNIGTTSILDNPRLVTFRNKNWASGIEINPAMLEAARAINNYDVITEAAKSTDDGFNNFIENAAVFGVTGDQIPGLLNGSGIPQSVETANYYNGSINGSQIVDNIIEWAGAVRRFSNYRYQTEVFVLSPRLRQQFNKITFAIAGSTTDRSVLSVLKERLMDLNPNYRIVEAPICEQAKFMAFLPYDPELVGLGVVPLRQYVRPEKLDWHGSTLGVVAEQPESSLVVRTPNS
jgi:hypothetical protein